MKNTWMLVKPGESGDPVEFDPSDMASRNQLLGNAEVDFGALSRRFHYMVYEYSITDRWPMNWQFVSYGRGVTPVCGPALIYKVNEIGETVDMTPEDIEGLRKWIAANRFGLIIDGLTLDEPPA